MRKTITGTTALTTKSEEDSKLLKDALKENKKELLIKIPVKRNLKGIIYNAHKMVKEDELLETCEKQIDL